MKLKTMQANDKILIQQLTVVLTGQLEHYRNEDLVKMLNVILFPRRPERVIPALKKKLVIQLS